MASSVSSLQIKEQWFFGEKVHWFYLHRWYNKTCNKYAAPYAWNIVVNTPWKSLEWETPNSRVYKAMKEIWSKQAGIEAVNNAVGYNSNTTKTAFESLPVEFKLALSLDFHWNHYETKKQTGYYDAELGQAMLVYLVETFCEMAEHFWKIRMTKTRNGSLYVVTEIARDKQYLSTFGDLCGIWEVTRTQKGWTQFQLTNSHTQQNVLQKVLCHLVYEIVEGRKAACSGNPWARASAEPSNMDLVYITIACLVFHVLNQYTATTIECNDNHQECNHNNQEWIWV